jgi:uncharacterized membrane protein
VPTVCGTVDVRLTDGNQRGKTISTELPNGPGAPKVAQGDTVVMLYLPDSLSGNDYQIVDHKRDTPLWIIVGAFVLAVIAFGRWRGVAALAGLAVTFAVLLLFIIPAILAGSSPLIVAIVGSAAIMLSVLYITHGLAVSTSVAVAGTLASLVITGVMSAVAVAIAHLNGVSDEQTMTLNIFHGSVNMQGLLLAGIIIGSLGVLDDVTVTQAATVGELARANPKLGVLGLYRAATRVGRAHIAAVVNTIILAYAGTSMPLLILIAASDMQLHAVLTDQMIATEIVRGAVGTIGLIAAVPITTILAAVAAHRMISTQRQPTGAEAVPTTRRADDDDLAAEALLHRQDQPWAW